MTNKQFDKLLGAILIITCVALYFFGSMNAFAGNVTIAAVQMIWGMVCCMSGLYMIVKEHI